MCVVGWILWVVVFSLALIDFFDAAWSIHKLTTNTLNEKRRTTIRTRVCFQIPEHHHPFWLLDAIGGIDPVYLLHMLKWLSRVYSRLWNLFLRPPRLALNPILAPRK